MKWRTQTSTTAMSTAGSHPDHLRAVTYKGSPSPLTLVFSSLKTMRYVT